MPFFIVLVVYIVLIVVWMLFGIGLLFMTYGVITTEVPFVPISKTVIGEVEKIFPLKRGDVFYDLGSGDGRVVLHMARMYPDATLVGFDKAPLPYTLGKFWLWQSGLINARFHYKNFFHTPLGGATHIYMYLFPNVVQNILPKFERELKPGTRVISCDFPFKIKEPTQTVEVGAGRNKHTLYVYDF